MTTVNLHAEFDLDEIAQQVAQYISPSVIAREIDLYDVADNVDTDQIADRVIQNLDIDAYDVAEQFSVQDIAEKIDLQSLADCMEQTKMDQNEDLIQAVSSRELQQRVAVLEAQVKAMTEIFRNMHRALDVNFPASPPTQGWTFRLDPNDPANQEPF